MNKKAFTLIELLVVIMILGILAALITGNFFTSLKKGRDTKRKADLEQVQRALEMYYEDNQTYPVSVSFSGQLCHPDGCATKVYMQKVPNDPVSGKDYEYLSAGADYKIFTCLENDQQRLPYVSSGYSLTCGACENFDGTPNAECIWGVSSSNISP